MPVAGARRALSRIVCRESDVVASPRVFDPIGIAKLHRAGGNCDCFACCWTTNRAGAQRLIDVVHDLIVPRRIDAGTQAHDPIPVEKPRFFACS